jgi:endonuclease YncB( thermonuclease family)
MRNRVRVPLLLAALVAVAFLFRWVLTAPLPVTAPPEPVPTPAAEAPPPDAAPAPEASASPETAVPAPPPEPALPPLPEIAVGDHPIHQVPVDPTPASKPGQPLDPGRNAGQSQEVAQGPSIKPLPSAPRQFTGTAAPTGGIELTVGTTTVELFGVKPPDPSEHCGTGADSDCRAAAQRALAKQLGNSGKVSCHVPNVRPGVTIAFAICLDATGVDLGGYLIGAGLAVADTGQSYDYVGAESIARNLKQGLWHFR